MKHAVQAYICAIMACCASCGDANNREGWQSFSVLRHIVAGAGSVVSNDSVFMAGGCGESGSEKMLLDSAFSEFLISVMEMEDLSYGRNGRYVPQRVFDEMGAVTGVGSFDLPCDRGVGVYLRSYSWHSIGVLFFHWDGELADYRVVGNPHDTNYFHTILEIEDGTMVIGRTTLPTEHHLRYRPIPDYDYDPYLLYSYSEDLLMSLVKGEESE